MSMEWALGAVVFATFIGCGLGFMLGFLIGDGVGYARGYRRGIGAAFVAKQATGED